MARPQLPLGGHGKITVHPVGYDSSGEPTRWNARTQFRGLDGVRRPVNRSGPTEKGAVDRLKEAVRAIEPSVDLDMGKLVSGDQPPVNYRPHIVYRLYDAEGVLLYVGMTSRMWSRVLNHQSGQPWGFQIVRIELERWPCRESARETERTAILTENPRYNIRP